MTVNAAAPARVAVIKGGTPAPGTERRGLFRIIGTSCTWLIVAFNIFILIFMIVSSFKSTNEIFGSTWSLPASPRWDNWTDAWSSSGFGRAALITVVLVIGSALTTNVIAAPAAYMLSRTQNRAAGILTVFFTLGIGVPAQVIVIPLFVMMSWVDLINNLFGLYVVYTAICLPFTVFLLTAFFRSLPSKLEEAGTLDGASPVQVFVRIMLPLARAGLVTAFILNAIGLWNETLIALVFIQDTGKQTLSLALLSFVSVITQYSAEASYGALFAGMLVLVLPMVALYVWLGRRITEGITFGATK
jgi:multiple sugar transport system permease protein/N-acetylglucosamine transport system permease protein